MAAAGLTLALFAAMPVFLRMNSTEAGEELATALPPVSAYAYFEMPLLHGAGWPILETWRCLCPEYHLPPTGRFLLLQDINYREARRQQDLRVNPITHETYGWPPSEAERLQRNSILFREMRPEAAIPTLNNASLNLRVLPIRRVHQARLHPCFLPPAYPHGDGPADGDVILRFDRTDDAEMVNVTIESASHPRFESAMQDALRPCRTSSDIGRTDQRMTVQFRLD
ncbi:hypothetical protein [Hyphobacterium marinum]|uniref:TonB C-terminal domain-containing protein n=1 Tax=Hyphobacterium marinum TaxID=3116574 RepID=A0ABU7LW44_9PROT|nr:hypothetical protein [Hyphobacterium sp. Y6023]MEE2565200.1 hypothetical protein [Hyphobacterium sp. Y6023]